MEPLLRSLRQAVRALRRQPVFTATAIVTLALGIGANTTIFSAVRYLLLDPLPVRNPGELRLAYWTRPQDLRVMSTMSTGYTDPETGLNLTSNYSFAIARALEDRARSLGGEAAKFNFLREVSVAASGQPAVLAGGMMADGRLFHTLGVGMTLGRPIEASDDVPGAPPVVVLGHAFWTRAFGGDPAILGRTVRLNGAPFEVIGVTAAGFRGISRGGFFPLTDVTVPLAAQPLVLRQRGGPLADDDRIFWTRLLVRVPPTVQDAPLAQALTATLRPMLPEQTTVDMTPVQVRLRPGARGEGGMRADGRRVLFILSGAVGVVLLIACVNLASLLLARGVARQRELAVRRALGATRWQLARQLLLESLLLSLAGAAGGLVLTLWSSGLLRSLLAAGLNTLGVGPDVHLRVGLDPTLLLATIGIAMLAALLFGALPALRLIRVNPAAHLAGRTVGAAPKLTLGRVLIAFQIAVSVPLVVGAALFLRTLSNLGAVELGFDPKGLVLFGLSPEYASVPDSATDRFYLDVMRRLEAIPGVQAVTLIENPLMSGLSSGTNAKLDGREVPIRMNAVGPGFFQVMGMRVLAGRTPGLQDHLGTPNVGVVNEAAVRELFGGLSPLGRTVRFGSRDVEIVGIVSDSRYTRQREAVEPILFDAALQRGGFGGHHLVLRTALSPAALEPAVRRAIAEVNPDLPVPALQTETAQIEHTSARERVLTRLLALFGVFALLLASIGVHGVSSYAVARRTGEIGVRVALGALPRQVLWLILRQVVVLAGFGLAAGIGIALAAGPLVRSLLYEVSPADPVLLVAASLVMLLVAVGAGLLPARRAAKVDPLVALRAE